MLSSLLESLADWYDTLQAEGGTEKVLEAWISRSSYATGKAVKVINGDVVLEGVTSGLQSDGALRLKTKTGEMKLIRSGDVVSIRPQ
jgi:biotin-(acetyl-CoA carboxylase) ligase